MENNKVFLSFDMSGNFLSLKKGSGKIYAGSVASVEYYIDFTENLSSNDRVYISFIRPDNQVVSPLLCERIQDNRFRHLSTGKELDVELDDVGSLTIEVLIKNRYPISETTKLKTQANVDTSIYPGGKFVPGIIENEMLANFEEHLNNIEKYTVKRYDVSDIGKDVFIDYEKDGIKFAPAFYVGFESIVYDYDWNESGYTASQAKGNLLVLTDTTDESSSIQYEYFFVGSEIYARKIIISIIEDVANVTTSEFYNICFANSTLITSLTNRFVVVSSDLQTHNQSESAHADIRYDLQLLSNKQATNTEKIKTNSNNIIQLRLDLSGSQEQIQNILSNLQNFYTKTDTYSKEEVNRLLKTAGSMQFVVVDTLPEQGDKINIYLVPKSNVLNSDSILIEDTYDEYIWLESKQDYECIGSTVMNLGNYVTITQFNELAMVVNQKANYEDLPTVIRLGGD